jgi:hypothetical protein
VQSQTWLRPGVFLTVGWVFAVKMHAFMTRALTAVRCDLNRGLFDPLRYDRRTSVVAQRQRDGATKAYAAVCYPVTQRIR